jgi:Ca2+-binding RTX toxin-like protein
VADRSKRHLERVLRDCAEAGVPETAAPWPEIRERLGGQGTDEARASEAQAGEGRAADAPRARRPLLVPDRPLGWALAALSVLILGLGAYAASGPVRELVGGGPLGPGSPGSGSPGTDNVVVGTPERDQIHRGGGDDTIRALAGNDAVFDTEGRNVAYGGDGDDWITISGSGYGGPGEDTIEGVFREGKAVGGPGADLILVHNDERNTVSCGTGRDTVYFDKELDSLAADCERQIPREYDVPGDVPFSEG